VGKSTRYLESPATPEEDSYRYRVEWDDIIESHFEDYQHPENWYSDHLGPGREEIVGFDNAWDRYNDLDENIDYCNVRLIRMDADGNEVSRWPEKSKRAKR